MREKPIKQKKFTIPLILRPILYRLPEPRDPRKSEITPTPIRDARFGKDGRTLKTHFILILLWNGICRMEHVETKRAENATGQVENGTVRVENGRGV